MPRNHFLLGRDNIYRTIWCYTLVEFDMLAVPWGMWRFNFFDTTQAEVFSPACWFLLGIVCTPGLMQMSWSRGHSTSEAVREWGRWGEGGGITDGGATPQRHATPGKGPPLR